MRENFRPAPPYGAGRGQRRREPPRGHLRSAWLADSIAANYESQRPESGAVDRRTGKAADVERRARMATIAKGPYDNGNDSL